MSIQFTKLSSILLITATSSLFAISAQAQTQPENLERIEPLSTLEVFEKAYFEHTGDAFQNDSILGQLNTIFGFKQFPEKQIALDGKLVDTLYRDVMKTQSQNGAPMKTRDLNNPYDTSLQQNPDYIGY